METAELTSLFGLNSNQHFGLAVEEVFRRPGRLQQSFPIIKSVEWNANRMDKHDGIITIGEITRKMDVKSTRTSSSEYTSDETGNFTYLLDKFQYYRLLKEDAFIVFYWGGNTDNFSLLSRLCACRNMGRPIGDNIIKIEIPSSSIYGVSMSTFDSVEIPHINSSIFTGYAKEN